ncbi:PadR family transcriptional regulator [Glycomyces harbinensis]|uniref:DNA-binding transcriptional regulator, PadR family n=1 Tax=Glycomyces harbinensis TaxID=58114 RepID=A0A1G6SWS3_9ACTN|nr:PadR family transcriptional regulator [Glycomyces harbinensis]SDD21034.1 DNA-binding transcriptional regulator, PadR family [Glycomyces harbinensis]
MSVKHSLLALLERGPAYGYQLRAAFESATGNTWPLNIGQVYTTLNRLERDHLVEALPENDSGQRPYRITESGRHHLAGWFASPVQAADRPRDELTIKLALAVTTPGVDVADVIQRQRSATLRLLQEFTRLKAAEDHAELAWRLVLESMIFRAEAEIRWLDHTEAVVARSDLPAPSPFAMDSADPGSATVASPDFDQSESR